VPKLGYSWGETEAERRAAYPCDSLIAEPHQVCHRAISVDAPAPHVWRWLCQLRAAPYSYDWIDNWGRRSPQELVPGAEDLEVGQRVMSIFRLVDFEPDRHLTLMLVRARRVFGDVAVSYLVVPEGAERCRLVVKLLVNHPGPAALRPLVRRVGPLGDLVMMRRQLLNLERLAEQMVSRPAASPP
jgi:hypothetical protein